MTDMTGKVAVVTGSARGIGRAIAQRFASLGADVVVNYSGDRENALVSDSNRWMTAQRIELSGGAML